MTTSLLNILGTQLDENEEGAPVIIEQSPYYDNEKAIELLREKQNMLTLLSLNCQSLHSKFPQLQGYLKNMENFNFNFSIICVQETWLSLEHDDTLYQLDGYNFVQTVRRCSTHGGVGIYIKNSLNYKVLPYIGNVDIWDGIFIEFYLSDTNNITQKKKVVLGNIYRPPRTISENYKIFYDEIQEILSQYIHTNTEIILTGDFNIDLMQIHEKEHVKDFMEMLTSNGLVPKITSPTRLTEHSKTLIDNCFVRLSTAFSKTTAGIMTSALSDHLPYFVAFDYLIMKKQKVKYIKCFLNNEQAKRNFKDELCNTLSMEMFKTGYQDNPNENYDIFDKVIETALQKHMPVKIFKFNKHKHKKSEWITRGIINSIKFRDKLYQRLKKTPPTNAMYVTLKTNLQTYNRILKQNIRNAKVSYYKSNFEKYRNDMKSTWTMIKEIINKSTTDSNHPVTFRINDTEQNDPNVIADEFNKFFVEIGPKLASNMQTSLNFGDYLLRPPNTTFNFHNVNENTVSKIIDRLKPKTSCGRDNMSNKLLKYVKSEITPYLTLFINQSINTGIFPSKLKLAKVLPIHKKDDKSCLENYRPISILPSVSKVFERVIHNQLYEYFDSNNLLYHGQYGFKNNHSTELAALETLDRIITAMDENKIPLNIYLDLSKAFDTLDHNILIKKLEHYGVHGHSLQLLHSYLYHRQQYVVFNDKVSELLPITTGVPQGSILGPFLFIIYVNDLVNACNIFKPVVYADDTNLSTSLEAFGTSHREIESNINQELNSINQWFQANKLSINETKTKAMYFHTHQREVLELSIKLNGKDIEFVKEFNYLGIILDSNITWKQHIKHIFNKISRTAGIMSKLKNYLPIEIMQVLYKSLITPYLNYGILVWGTKSKHLLKLQKKIIRIMSNAKYNAHTLPIFKNYNILRIDDILKLQELRFIYKLENKTLPKYYLDTMFIRQSEIHNYQTRQANDFRTPQSSHKFTCNSIRHRLPAVYNNCSPSIKNKIYTHSYAGFTNYIKYQMIQNYNVTCTINNCYVCQNMN